MTLEEQIRNYRKQAGMSQEKMAELIGVSRQAITKWENGTGTPDIANLVAIAIELKVWNDLLLFMFDVNSPYWNIVWGFFIALGAFAFCLGMKLLK